SPTYPGIYIEELPSTSHPITAAPTSIAVFVGYTHPFKTKNAAGNENFGKPVPIFSFTDYERYFGGFFKHGTFRSKVAQAVYQFFLNGGALAYVVGVQPQYLGTESTPLRHAVTAASIEVSGIRFTALEPTNEHTPDQPGDLRMKVTIDGLRSSTGGSTNDV